MIKRKRGKDALLNGDVEVLSSATSFKLEEVRAVKQKLACEVLGLCDKGSRSSKQEGEATLKTLFKSPAMPDMSCEDRLEDDLNLNNLRYEPRPTGLASLDTLLNIGERSGAQEKGKKKKGWPAATAIEIFDYTPGGGHSILLCSTALACAKAGMKVVFFDATNSLNGSVFDKFISSLTNGKNKAKYQGMKSQTGDFYEAIKVVEIKDIWDLIDKLVLLGASDRSAGGNDSHFIGILGLSRMIAELDAHLLYQTITDRNTLSSGTGHYRKKTVTNGEPSLRALLHRLGIAIRSLTASGSTVVTVSTPIDAEQQNSARKFTGKAATFVLSGQSMHKTQTFSTEGFVCRHMACNSRDSSCSCAIVRMAFIRVFQDVFDLTMDLAPSPVVSEKNASGEMILSFRCKSVLLNGAGGCHEEDKNLHCVIRDLSTECNIE